MRHYLELAPVKIYRDFDNIIQVHEVLTFNIAQHYFEKDEEGLNTIIHCATNGCNRIFAFKDAKYGNIYYLDNEKHFQAPICAKCKAREEIEELNKKIKEKQKLLPDAEWWIK